MENQNSNIENTQSGIKNKLKSPIFITILVLLLSSCCCSGIGIASGNKDKSESSSISEVWTEEPSTEKSTEEQTSESKTESKTETTTEKTTTAISATEEMKSIVTTTAIEISSENFVDTIKEATKGAVGENEYITDIVLTDGTLTISVDLSKSNPMIYK